MAPQYCRTLTQVANMPVSLPSSQVPQSAATKDYDAAVEADDISDPDSIPSPSSQSSNSDDSLSDLSMSSKPSASDAQYPAELAAAKIYPAERFEKAPANYHHLSQHLGRERDDLTLNSTEIASYSKAVYRVGNEDEMMLVIIPWVLDVKNLFLSDKFSITCNRPWNLQDTFSEQLGNPQPDITIGLSFDPLSEAFPQALHPQAFSPHGRLPHQKLFQYLQPFKGTVLPVTFFEAKGPKGLSSEAGLQNRHNGACGIKNVVAIKRAASRPPKTYVGTILAYSIEITTESVQATCHWMTTSRDGGDQYWSAAMTQPPINVHDLPAVQRLIRNVLDLTESLLQELIKDISLLDKQITREKQRFLEKQLTGERKRARSPSSEVQPAGKTPGKRRRGG